jgi:hypothetical protein
MLANGERILGMLGNKRLVLSGFLIVASVLLVSCGTGFLKRSSGVVIPEAELVIHWRQEEGVLNVCDELYLYRGGAAQAFAYGEGSRVGVGQGQLRTEDELRLEDWVTTYRPFEYQAAEPTTVDVMTVTMTFTGKGNAEASDDVKLEIEGFAQQLFDELRGEIPR